MKRRLARLWCTACAAALACLFLTTPPLSQNGYPEWDGAPFFAHTPDRIDLNTAPAAELCCLPGIGQRRAEAIIDYRTQNGAFTSVEELCNISGISMRTVEGLRALVSISEGAFGYG